MSNILIIGAGPVGLYLASEIKRLSPKSDVTIWEKRSAHVRDQIVILNEKNITRLPKKVKTGLFGRHKNGCYVKPPPFDQSGRCYITKGKRKLGSITLKYLEEELQAHNNNVNIIQKTGNTTSIRKVLNDYDYIIGAGGTKSAVRRFLKGKVKKHPIGYGLIVTFNSPKPSLQRKPVVGAHFGSISELPQQRFRAFRSQDANSYMALQLTKKEYSLVKNKTSYDEIPPDIQNTIIQLADFYGIVLPSTNMKVGSFPINLSISDTVCKKVGSTTVATIGDAYMGVSFFSGLGVNYGMDEAALLAKIISNRSSTLPLKTFMKGIAKARKNASRSLSLPSARDQKKCISKVTIGYLDKLGTSSKIDVRMLSKKNKCFVLSRSRDLMDILGTGTVANKKSAKKSAKKCPKNKILNPKSGRCVLRTGKIGRKLV